MGSSYLPTEASAGRTSQPRAGNAYLGPHHFMYFRMSKETFDFLLQKVSTQIKLPCVHVGNGVVFKYIYMYIVRFPHSWSIGGTTAPSELRSLQLRDLPSP